MNTRGDKPGDLRVWHIPRIPGQAFYVPVRSPEEGKRILDVLAQYDAFRSGSHIKPDYAQGLEMVEESDHGYEWYEWQNEWGFGIDHMELVNGKLEPID